MKFLRITVTVVCAGWASGVLSYLDTGVNHANQGGLGFGGGVHLPPPGVNTVDRGPAFIANTMDAPHANGVQQSCDGTALSLSNSPLCPPSPLVPPTRDPGVDGLGFSGVDYSGDVDFSPGYSLTRDCTTLGFSGLDLPCVDTANSLFGVDTGYIEFALDYSLTRDCTTLGFSGLDLPCRESVLLSPTDPDSSAIGDPDGSTGNPTGGSGASPVADLPGGAQPSADVGAPGTLALMGLGLLTLRYYRKQKPQF